MKKQAVIAGIFLLFLTFAFTITIPCTSVVNAEVKQEQKAGKSIHQKKRGSKKRSVRHKRHHLAKKSKTVRKRRTEAPKKSGNKKRNTPNKFPAQNPAVKTGENNTKPDVADKTKSTTPADTVKNIWNWITHTKPSTDDSDKPYKKKYDTCTIRITADKYYEKSSAKIKNKLPSGGIILSTTKVQFRPGESVYDVLARTCRSTSMSLGEMSAFGSTYVKSIGGLAENRFMKPSGWIYSVNGDYPTVYSNDKKVASGDSIVWSYVYY